MNRYQSQDGRFAPAVKIQALVTFLAVFLPVLTVRCGGNIAASDGPGGGGGTVARPDGGSTAQAGTVRGAAVDPQGRPLAGASITIRSTVFYSSSIQGTTAANGSYSFELPADNVWKAEGSLTRTLAGISICSELAVDNTDSFSSSAATVRNFSWKLNGTRPGRQDDNHADSYFGAWLRVNWSDPRGDPLFETSRLRVNFVPNGPLIDGSSGRSFSEIVGRWSSNEIGNIPIGVYNVSADYLPPSGGAIPLQVSTGIETDGTEHFARSVPVKFQHDDSFCLTPPSAQLHAVGP